MAQYTYGSGLGSTGQYIISGRPFMTGGYIDGTVTGSYGGTNGEVGIEFPTVTKSLTVINRGDTTLYVHFDTRSNPNVIDHHHYMSLPNTDDSYGFDIRCTRVYISQEETTGTGEFELHAEMTGINSEEMHLLSGSGINS